MTCRKAGIQQIRRQEFPACGRSSISIFVEDNKLVYVNIENERVKETRFMELH